MSAVVEGIVLVDEKAAPVPGALVSPIRQTPASVQAILGSRASSSVAPPTGWRTLRIRVQLLLAYGLLSLVAFGSLIGICAFITNNSADSVVSTSREELTKQVVNNSILMLGEAGLVLDARLQDGFSVLVQPTTFALYDILGGTSSLVPLPSYTETTVDHLKPPTSYEDRYHCVSTANDAVTGCGTDGLQPLSLTASSVYVVGSSLSGDGWGSADAAAWLAVNQTSVLDVFAKEAFGTRTAWVDTFVSGVTADPGPALFRQYPGAVGSLDATSDGTRTYDPSTRSWYTRVESAGALDATTTSEYLPQRPMYLSSPFLDQFGRGYLLTVAAPIVGPNGQVVGVSGADVLVSSLQSIVATIQSRATGEAFLVHRATGNVVASRQIDTSFAITTIPLIDSLALPGETTSTFADLASGGGIVAELVSDASGGGSLAASAGGDEYQLVWKDVWEGAYLLLTCTRVDEIQAPIESQLDAIYDQAAALFGVSLLISAICLGVIVVLVLVLSTVISKTVSKTVDQSSRIVRNIGGDLFAGVKIEGRAADAPETWKDKPTALAGIVVQKPGEVAALRGEFLKALYQLGQRRLREPPPTNPFYGQPPPLGLGGHVEAVDAAPAPYGQLARTIEAVRPRAAPRARRAAARPPTLPRRPPPIIPGGRASAAPLPLPPLGLRRAAHPPARATRAQSRTPGTAAAKEALDKALTPPHTRPLTIWNKTVSKIFFWLLLPTMLAMVVTIIVVFSVVKDDIRNWVAPVRETMVEEEISSLRVRTYERALFTAAYIDTAAGSLEVLSDFATQLADGALPHAEPLVTYFSPSTTCPLAAEGADALPLSDYFSCTALSLSRGPRPDLGYSTNNYQAPATYTPSSTLPASVTSVADTVLNLEPGESTTALDVSAIGSEWAKEQLAASQLDAALSAVFFSSNVTYAYAALHATETYRQFPYQDLASFTMGSRTCDASPSTTITAYSPLCRPWYQAALSSIDVVYNQVLEDLANPGKMFLSLSKAWKSSAGELVGVLGVDVGLADLADKIGGEPAEGNLYERGYAMLWDADGYAIVHKNYAQEQYVNQGPQKVILLDSGSDTQFMEAFEVNVVNRGRVSGNWSYPWYNSAKGKDEVWHYAFQPVPDTPYMIALTVVADDVTAAPDEAEGRVLSQMNAAAGGSVAMCLGVLAALFAVTWWLNTHFAAGLLWLLHLVEGWSKRDFSGDIDDTHVRDASSRELSSLMNNFKDMLVALRFGTDSWAKGSVAKAMDNTLDALKLVESTGNQRGVGVALNNLALAMADEQVRSKYPKLEAGELYAAAIENARGLITSDPENAAKHADAVAMRCLNCALWNMRAKPPRADAAAAMLDTALKHCTSARTLSTVALYVSPEPVACGSWDGTTLTPPDPTINHAVASLVMGTLTLTTMSQGPRLQLDDCDVLADLAAAHCDVSCWDAASGGALCTAPQLALWALLRVPAMTSSTFTRLCVHAKAGGSDALTKYIDEFGKLERKATGAVPLGGAVAKIKAMSGSAPKVMMFVLDLSFSMNAKGGGQGPSRLDVCKTSLTSILKDNLEPEDRAGLISFADDVRDEFPLLKAGEASNSMGLGGSPERKRMLNSVNNMRCRGMTAFYEAVEVGAARLKKELAGEPDTPKWLVALTDGADNKSSAGAANRAIELLSSTPNLNLALITVGTDMDMKVTKTFLNAAEKAGNTSMLVKASNQQQISEAFATVAQAMGGVKEVL